MKKYLLAAFLLVTCEVLAQTTTITATIPTYANGVAVITFNPGGGATVGFNLYGNASESGLPFLASKYGVGGDSIPLCLFGTPSACAINIDASNVVSIPALTGTKLPVCETNGVLTAGTNTAGTISCP